MIEIDKISEIGQFLGQARVMAGLSVDDLAEKLGYVTSVLQAREDKGYPNISINEALKVLRAMGLTVKIVVTK
jgi:ribosome-binding protein aMBF1 (putative translation factor)